MSPSFERTTTSSTSCAVTISFVPVFLPIRATWVAEIRLIFEVTGGVTIKPPLPKPIAGLLIRPEVRYDRALTNTTPFNQNTKQDQWTLGLDLVLEF